MDRNLILMPLQDRRTVARSEVSRFTRQNSKDLIKQEEVTSSPGLCCGESGDSTNMDWTEKKHTLYLNSMEASFVEHLNNKPRSTKNHSLLHNVLHRKSSRQLNTAENGKAVWSEGCNAAHSFRVSKSSKKRSAYRFCLHPEDPITPDSEVSDQNFVDEN